MSKDLIFELMELCPRLTMILNNEDLEISGCDYSKHFFFNGDTRVLILTEVACRINEDLEDFFSELNTDERIKELQDFYSGIGMGIVADDVVESFVLGFMDLKKQIPIWESIIKVLRYVKNPELERNDRLCNDFMGNLIGNPLVKEKLRLNMNCKVNKVSLKENPKNFIKQSCGSRPIVSNERIEEFIVDLPTMQNVINNLETVVFNEESPHSKDPQEEEAVTKIDESSIKNFYENSKSINKLVDAGNDVMNVEKRCLEITAENAKEKVTNNPE